MSATAPRYLAPGRFTRRVFNPFVARLAKWGVSFKGTRLLDIRGRQTGIVRMLLEAGANPDKADYASGYSARDYAKRDSRSTEMVRLMDTVKAKKTATVGPVRP